MNNTAIDLEAFEQSIRADEREKIKHEMRMRRMTRIREKRARVELLKRYAIQRISGLVMIVASILLVTSDAMYDVEAQANDGTFLLLTVPLGLYLLLTKDLCMN